MQYVSRTVFIHKLTVKKFDFDTENLVKDTAIEIDTVKHDSEYYQNQKQYKGTKVFVDDVSESCYRMDLLKFCENGELFERPDSQRKKDGEK